MNPVFLSTPPTIEWLTIMPTMIVSIAGVIALCIEMFRPKQTNNAIVLTSLLGLLAAGMVVVMQFSYPDGDTFGGMVERDRFGLIMQLLLLGAAFLTVLFSDSYLREKRISFGEFYPLLLWSTVGGMVIATTTNLLMVFLGIEVLSIALYVMAGMSRSENKSEESALKYFLLGAFASGFLLYGIAMLYGATGSIELSAITHAWGAGNPTTHVMMLFGVALFMVGLSFKAAFVPFHQWTPDVYQGAPTNVTAFMAAGSKIAALAAVWRFLGACHIMQEFWFPALFWIAILTMTVGNLVALVQKDVKRVLGYSSISNAGYILVGILAHLKSPATIGFGTTVYYLLSYSCMTIGAFAVITLAARGGKEGTNFSELHGMWRRSPLAAVSLIVFMSSLIGIPLTSGFVGKFLIFNDARAAGLMPLAIVLAVNSIISLAYYLALGKAMFVDDAEEGEETKPVRLTPGLATACILCMAGIFGAFIFYTPLMDFMTQR